MLLAGAVGIMQLPLIALQTGVVLVQVNAADVLIRHDIPSAFAEEPPLPKPRIAAGDGLRVLEILVQLKQTARLVRPAQR